MKSLQCLCKYAFIQYLKLQGNASRQSSNMSNKTTKEIFPSICNIVSPTSSGISYIPEPYAWTINGQLCRISSTHCTTSPLLLSLSLSNIIIKT